MKAISTIFQGTVLLIFAACTGGKHLEMTSGVESAYLEGDFQKALEISEEIIGKMETGGKQASGKVYTMAGISAYELEEYGKSLDYLLKAQLQGYSEGRLHLYLARNYRHIDNLSKEISALEAYLSEHPQGRESENVRGRLFTTCIESENLELALMLWDEMDSISREDVANLETYLELSRMMENERLSDSLAVRILEKDPDSEPALKWSGEYYFWKAENSYQYQMKEYKENRTHKQYAILLAAFKQVDADFKKSLGYFLRLYKLNPLPEYAGYLGNIYTRLEDGEKASYYKNRAD